MSENISESIRRMRIEKRMTQEDLSKLSMVSRRAISAMENELTVATVNMRSVMRVLDTLGCSLKVTETKTPTLMDLINDKDRLQPSISTRSRVRKTLDEQQEDDGQEDAPCSSMSM